MDKVCSRRPTCLHHVLHGGEALADAGADGAEDEDGTEVDVAHHGPTEQPAILIPALDTAGDRQTGGRQTAGDRETGGRQTHRALKCYALSVTVTHFGLLSLSPAKSYLSR